MVTKSPTDVVVSDNAALAREIDRLAKGEGGTILLAPKSDPYSVSLVDFRTDQTDAPITITSLDRSNPAVLDRFHATNRENLTLTEVVVRQTGDREDYGRFNFILQARASENITIDNVTFEGSADGVVGVPGSDARRPLDLATFKDSTDITVRDSVVSGFHNNFVMLNADDVELRGNEIFGFTGDGVRIAGSQDIVIEGNTFRDPYGSTERVNHDDMIQFWGTNITQNTERVAIRDNLFHVGEAHSYQMIFGNNEDRKENGWLFEDIVVEHNVVFGSNAHMISLGDTRDLVVRHNTVVINDETRSLLNDGSFRDPYPGYVTVRNSVGAQVEKNVAEAFRDKAMEQGNTILTRDSVEPGGNVRDHLVNYEALGSGDLRDLMLVPDSSLNGKMGSRLTWFSPKSDDLLAVAQVERSPVDLSRVALDASLTRDEGGLVGEGEARFTWTFDDGTTQTGQRVEHDFEAGGRRSYSLEVRHDDGSVDRIDRDIEIEHATLLDLQTSGSKLVDASPHDTEITIDGDVRVSSSGFELRGAGANDTYVEIPRDEDHVQGRKTFNIGLTLDPEAGSSGTFLEVGRVLEASVTKSGAATFSLMTLDTGGARKTVSTPDGVFGDGGAHHLNFVYDGNALKVFVDGDLVGQTALTGKVVDGGWYGFRIGNFWSGAGFEGEISNFLMRGEPSSDGVVAKAYQALAQGKKISLDLYAGDGASFDDGFGSKPAPAPLPEAAPAEPQQPVAPEGGSLTLIDAQANAALLALGARTVLEATSVEGMSFNVAAEAAPEQTASVRFALDGEAAGVENVEPYAMLGDKGGRYNEGLVFAAGDERLIEASFHGAKRGAGEALGETASAVSVQDGTLEGQAGAPDVFAFHEGRMGRDAIANFEKGDTLAFLGGATADEILAAAEVEGDDTVIDFGGGHALVLKDFTGLALDDILT